MSHRPKQHGRSTLGIYSVQHLVETGSRANRYQRSEHQPRLDEKVQCQMDRKRRWLPVPTCLPTTYIPRVTYVHTYTPYASGRTRSITAEGQSIKEQSPISSTSEGRVNHPRNPLFSGHNQRSGFLRRQGAWRSPPLPEKIPNLHLLCHGTNH